MNIKITGSGSYIPTEVVSNIDFAQHTFLNQFYYDIHKNGKNQ